MDIVHFIRPCLKQTLHEEPKGFIIENVLLPVIRHFQAQTLKGMS